MSKYLAVSLMAVAWIVGIIFGFVIAPKTTETSKKLSMIEREPSVQVGTYTDQQFLADMIAHHQDAITMSKRVFEHTSRKEIREMASTIIDTQSKEIVTMNDWLVQWQ